MPSTEESAPCASPPSRIGLVLTGGGARAAYQAGVLRGIAEILGSQARPLCPFHSISGVSAGAINAAFIGCHATDFSRAASNAWDLWHGLKSERILRTGTLTLGMLAARWMRDLSLGGFSPLHGKMNHLLDTEPLHGLLREILDFNALEENLRNGCLHGMSVTATHYGTGTAVSFFDGDAGIEPWIRSTRIGKRTRLSQEHILASAAIPILFRPVRVGNSLYGDGSVRFRAPLSTAIHLGSDRILAIGIHHPRSVEKTLELDQQAEMKDVTVAEIAGVLLNAVFMDGLEVDIERLQRINQTLKHLSEQGTSLAGFPLRSVPLLAIRPSRDLGTLASDQFGKQPRMLRHLLRGIGASESTGWDLFSYLSFDSSYTIPLLELGYADAFAQRDEIREFFFGAPPVNRPQRESPAKTPSQTA